MGDPVKVAIDKDDLILLNADGKETKMKITKRARAQAQGSEEDFILPDSSGVRSAQQRSD